MEPRKNKMVEKLKQDKMVISAKLNVTHHIPASIAAMAGFDAVWIDMEHVPADYNEINEVVLACKAYGCESVVRVPRGAYSNQTRPLEMDASAVMVPHCMSVEDAKHIARMTKFHPLGRRPIDGGYADGQYCMLGTADYLKHSNEDKITMIQIEDIEAYEQLEEIAQVPGIDMLFFGPADFAHSLGIPTDMGNEKVMEAKRRVAEVARKYGKWAGTVGGPAVLKDLYDMGYRYVNVCADVAILARNFREVVAACKEVTDL